MYSLCQVAKFHAIGFCQRRNWMYDLCQVAKYHAIGFFQRRNWMYDLCQVVKFHAIGFFQRRNWMYDLCQVVKFHAIGFNDKPKRMKNLCPKHAPSMVYAKSKPAQPAYAPAESDGLTPPHSSTPQFPQSCTRPHPPPSGRSAAPCPCRRRQACRSR